MSHQAPVETGLTATLISNHDNDNTIDNDHDDTILAHAYPQQPQPPPSSWKMSYEVDYMSGLSEEQFLLANRMAPELGFSDGDALLEAAYDAGFRDAKHRVQQFALHVKEQQRQQHEGTEEVEVSPQPSAPPCEDEMDSAHEEQHGVHPSAPPLEDLTSTVTPSAPSYDDLDPVPPPPPTTTTTTAEHSDSTRNESAIPNDSSEENRQRFTHTTTTTTTHHDTTSIPTKKRKLSPRLLLILFLIVLLPYLLYSFTRVTQTDHTTYHLLNLSWKHTMITQVYQPQQEQGHAQDIPTGAYKVKNHGQVLSHYRTVVVGSRQECHQEDVWEEVSHTREECHEEPRFVEREVCRTERVYSHTETNVHGNGNNDNNNNKPKHVFKDEERCYMEQVQQGTNRVCRPRIFTKRVKTGTREVCRMVDQTEQQPVYKTRYTWMRNVWQNVPRRVVEGSLKDGKKPHWPRVGGGSACNAGESASSGGQGQCQADPQVGEKREVGRLAEYTATLKHRQNGKVFEVMVHDADLVKRAFEKRLEGHEVRVLTRRFRFQSPGRAKPVEILEV